MVHTVDNFDLFAKKLFETPLKEDEFYFLQILVRGKDGHHVSGNNKNRLVKYYTITSPEQLFSLKNEILAICHVDNARAYIHPTKRNAKEVANLAIENAVHTFVSQNWIGFKSMYSTACGQSFVKGDKKFIVDLDDIHEGDLILDEIRKKLYSYRGHGGENSDKVFMTVPTKSGVHLVTWPFDIGQFTKDFPGIDIHKNNPTLLYFRWADDFDEYM
jgi:hypothetical protein